MKTLLHDEFIDLVERTREAQKFYWNTPAYIRETRPLEKKLDAAIAQYRKLQKSNRFKK